MALIADLRNTAHGQVISEIKLREAGTEETTLLQLPARAFGEVARFSDTPLGRKAKGLAGMPIPKARLGGMWDPYVLVQMLVPFAAEALKAIMASTEVEKLPGVTAPRWTPDPGPRSTTIDPRANNEAATGGQLPVGVRNPLKSSRPGGVAARRQCRGLRRRRLGCWTTPTTVSCGVCVRGIRARCLMRQLVAALVARGLPSRVIDAGV